MKFKIWLEANDVRIQQWKQEMLTLGWKPNEVGMILQKAINSGHEISLGPGLISWKKELMEQGFSEEQIHAAIQEAGQFGIDVTNSDDLYSLEQYMSTFE